MAGTAISESDLFFLTPGDFPRETRNSRDLSTPDPHRQNPTASENVDLGGAETLTPSRIHNLSFVSCPGGGSFLVESQSL